MNRKLDFYGLFVVQVSRDLGSCKYFGGVCEGAGDCQGSEGQGYLEHHREKGRGVCPSDWNLLIWNRGSSAVQKAAPPLSKPAAPGIIMGNDSEKSQDKNFWEDQLLWEKDRALMDEDSILWEEKETL